MDVAEQFASILHEEAGERGLPGAAAGLVIDGVEYLATYGVTSWDDPRDVDERTLFQIGSITKTFTSLLVAQLVEAGLVDFDDEAARHLSGQAARLDLGGITVRHLLGHTSGIDGDVLLTGPVELATVGSAARLFAPGTEFSYSNAGFTLAGELISAVTGRTYDEVLGENVLGPLGMHDATCVADRALFRRVALPHVVFPGHDPIVMPSGGWQPGWELHPLDRPTGGLAASITELMRWGRFHLGDGTVPEDPSRRIVGQGLLEELHRPAIDGEPGTRIGLDWFNQSIEGTRVLGHGGLTVGYGSQLYLLPENGVVFGCLTNATNGALVHGMVWDRVLREILGSGASDPAPSERQPPAVELAGYTGTFRYSFGPITVTVAAEGAPGPLLATPEAFPSGTTRWQPPPEPPVHLHFTGPDEVATVDHAGPRARRMRFGRSADGSVDRLLWGSRLCPRIGSADPAVSGGGAGGAQASGR